MRGNKVIAIVRRRFPISGVATQPVYAAGPMSENSVTSFDNWLTDNTDYYVDEIIDVYSVSDAKDYLAR